MQQILASGKYDGAIWTEGRPRIWETIYWFNLLIDATLPICGNAAQRPHGLISADGPKNIVDSVDYIASRVWADEQAATRRALFSSRSSEFSPLAQSRKPMHDPEVMSRLAAMAESSARLAMMDRHSSTICRLPGTRGDPP